MHREKQDVIVFLKPQQPATQQWPLIQSEGLRSFFGDQPAGFSLSLQLRQYAQINQWQADWPSLSDPLRRTPVYRREAGA